MLPADALVHSLQYLETRDRIQVSLVNRDWCSLILNTPETWINHNITVKCNGQDLSYFQLEFLKRCKVSRITLIMKKTLNENSFHLIAQILRFPWLKHLCLRLFVGSYAMIDNKRQDIDNILKQYIPTQMNLQSLEIWYKNCEFFLHFLQVNSQSIEQLTLRYPVDSKFIERILSPMKQLRELRIISLKGSFTSPEAFDKFASMGLCFKVLDLMIESRFLSMSSCDKLLSASNLKKLGIICGEYSPLDPTDRQDVIDNSYKEHLVCLKEQPSMEELSLVRVPCPYDFIRVGVSTLKVLELRECQLLLPTLQSTCLDFSLPVLETLTLGNCHTHIMVAFLSVCSEQRLRSIILYRIKSSHMLENFGCTNTFKHVRYLTMYDCDFETEVTVFTVIRSCIELERLVVEDLDGNRTKRAERNTVYSTVLAVISRIHHLTIPSTLFLALPLSVLPAIKILTVQNEGPTDDIIKQRMTKCTQLQTGTICDN